MSEQAFALTPKTIESGVQRVCATCGYLIGSWTEIEHYDDQPGGSRPSAASRVTEVVTGDLHGPCPACPKKETSCP